MADPEHLAVLEQGIKAWNKWRKRHPEIQPDLLIFVEILFRILTITFRSTSQFKM